MRVTSGKYGGRKLADNSYAHIRPTADMVKQAIFNKLAGCIQGAKVLDLFCGTGALGIEALSRGAQEAVFADKDPRSLAQTKLNLKNLEIPDARVIKGDFKDALKNLKGEKFDLIFLDPPYMSGVYETAIKLIKEFDILSENGIIVCEHEKNVTVETEEFDIFDQKRYGIKMATYLTTKNQST